MMLKFAAAEADWFW